MSKRLTFNAEQLDKHYRVNAPVNDHHQAFRVKTVAFAGDKCSVVLEPDNSLIKDSVFLNRSDIETLLAGYIKRKCGWPTIDITWTDAGSENDQRRGEDYRLVRNARILSISERLIQEKKHAQAS